MNGVGVFNTFSPQVKSASSLFHFGVVNAEKSAVHVEKDDLDRSSNSPAVCRQCKRMKCPFHALTVLGGHSYHCDLCGGRPQCVKVCTTGAIRL
jgi:anaerobic carbon-monoxide dehydrogenase iron sulfur subunit